VSEDIDRRHRSHRLAVVWRRRAFRMATRAGSGVPC